MQQMQHQFSDWGFSNQGQEMQKRAKPSGCPPIQIKQKQQFSIQNKKMFQQDKSPQTRFTEQSENDKDSRNVSLNGMQNQSKHRIFEDNTSARRKTSINSFRDDEKDNIENFNFKENSLQDPKNMNQFAIEIKQMLANEQKKIAEFLKSNFLNNQQQLNNATTENKANEQKIQSIKLELSSSIEKLLQIQREEQNNSLNSSTQDIQKKSENLSNQQKQLEEKIEQFEEQFEQMQLAYKTLAQQQMNSQKGDFETKIKKMFDKFHEEINLLGDQICYTQQDLSQKVIQKKQQTDEQLNQLSKLIHNNFAELSSQVKEKQDLQELAEFFNNNYGSILLDISSDNKELMQQFKYLQQNTSQFTQQNQKSNLSTEQLQQKCIECEKNCQKFISNNQRNINEWENCQNDSEKVIEMVTSKQKQIDDSQYKQEQNIYSIQQALAFMKTTNEELTKQIDISKDKTQFNQLHQRISQIELVFQKKTEEMQYLLKQKDETIKQLSQKLEKSQLSSKKKIFNNNRDFGCQTDKIQTENIQFKYQQSSAQNKPIQLDTNDKINSAIQKSYIPQFGQDIKHSDVIVTKLSQFAQYSNQQNQFQSNPEFRWEEYEQGKANNCQQQVPKQLNFDKNPSKIDAMLQQFEDYDEENEKIAVVNSSSSSHDDNNSDGEYQTSSESSNSIDNKDDEMFMPGQNSNQPSSKKPNQIWQKNNNQRESYEDYLKKYEFCITTNRDTIEQNQNNLEYQQFSIKNNVYCQPQNYIQDNDQNLQESNIQHEYEHFYPQNNQIQTNSLAQQIAEHQNKIQEQLKYFESQNAMEQKEMSNQYSQQMQQELIHNQQSQDLQKIEGFLRKRLLYINAISKQGFLNNPQQSQVLLCKFDSKRNLKDEFDHFILDEYGNPLNLNASEVQYFEQRQIIQVIQ